jgi:hypothetical protein
MRFIGNLFSITKVWLPSWNLISHEFPGVASEISVKKHFELEMAWQNA